MLAGEFTADAHPHCENPLTYATRTHRTHPGAERRQRPSDCRRSAWCCWGPWAGAFRKIKSGKVGPAEAPCRIRLGDRSLGPVQGKAASITLRAIAPARRVGGVSSGRGRRSAARFGNWTGCRRDCGAGMETFRASRQLRIPGGCERIPPVGHSAVARLLVPLDTVGRARLVRVPGSVRCRSAVGRDQTVQEAVPVTRESATASPPGSRVCTVSARPNSVVSQRDWSDRP